MDRKISQGIFFALVTAAISGFAIFYNKLVLVAGIDSLIFNILKNGGAAMVLSVLVFTSSKNKKSIVAVFPRQWRNLLLIGLVGGSVPFFLFFEGLRTVSAPHAAIIHKTLFVWVAIMALPLLQEKLSLVQIIGYLFIVYGNFVLGGFSGFHMGRGEWMILTATLLWAGETIIAKKILPDTGSLLLGWGRMFFGTIFLVIFALLQGRLGLFASIEVGHITAIGGSILLLTSYVMSWYFALRSAPAVIVTSVLVLSTPITTLLSALFITQTLSSPQLTSTLFMTAGVAMVAYAFPSIKQLISRRNE